MRFLVITNLLLLAFDLVGQREVEKCIESQGARTCYQKYGNGNVTMLIINGGPGMNSRGFEPLAKEFSKRFNISTITYDQRGTGNSTLIEGTIEDITLDLMIGDIEAIKQAEDLKEWVVFGQSFGGMLASYYATKHPESISSLILSSSGGIKMADLRRANIMANLSEEQRDSLNYWNQILNRNPNDKDLRYRRNLFLAPAYVIDSDYVPQIALRLGQVNMSLNAAIFRQLNQMEFDCTEDLKSFEKPVLIINGDDDIVSNEAASETDNLMINSSLKIVKGSRHYGWLDNPDEYFTTIREFIINGSQ